MAKAEAQGEVGQTGREGGEGLVEGLAYGVVCVGGGEGWQWVVERVTKGKGEQGRRQSRGER